MPKFISVLTSDEHLNYWRAVQWSETQSGIDGNNYYTAGVSMSLPKNAGDTKVGAKTIIEVSTQNGSKVSVYKLGTASVSSLKLASNKAGPTLIASLNNKINEQ